MPRTTMAPRSRTAIPMARPRLARRPPDAPSCGRTTSIGTTARSCTTSRPIMTRLASVWVTPAAASIFRTTAVLETEIMAPNQIASRAGIPRTKTAAARRRARGEQDLDGAADQGDTADGLEVAEGELEAEGEEEERYADFGEQLDLMDLDDSRAGSVGPDEDAGGNVADHEREAQGARGESADQAREDDQDEIGCDAQCL